MYFEELCLLPPPPPGPPIYEDSGLLSFIRRERCPRPSPPVTQPKPYTPFVPSTAPHVTAHPPLVRSFYPLPLCLAPSPPHRVHFIFTRRLFFAYGGGEGGFFGAQPRFGGRILSPPPLHQEKVRLSIIIFLRFAAFFFFRCWLAVIILFCVRKNAIKKWEKEQKFG